MRSITVRALVALAAVCALAAIAAATASATLPEFSGTLPNKFTGKGTIIIEVQTGGTYECKASISGRAEEGDFLKSVKILFTGNSCSYLCDNVENPDWETNKLEGYGGYLAKSTKTVGMLLISYKSSFALCDDVRNEASLTFSSGVMGELSPVNFATTELTLKFRGREGKQEWTHFEGEETLNNLEANEIYKKISFSGNIPLKFEKTIELKA